MIPCVFVYIYYNFIWLPLPLVPSFSSQEPSVASSGNNVFVAFAEQISGASPLEIFYTLSTDGGDTFTAPEVAQGTFEVLGSTSTIDISKLFEPTQTRTITIQSSDGFSGIVNLSAQVANPSDFSTSINPSSVSLSPTDPVTTATLTVTFVGDPTVASSVTVTGTNGITDSLTIPINGGCLIATATYGTPLAKEVQMLREIRDNTLLQTESGKSFMNTFNEYYYSFSPTVAQWERDSPEFRELVKTLITPMISTLSIMSLADEGSESQVVGLITSIIILNLGIYVGVPAVTVITIRKRLNSRK